MKTLLLVTGILVASLAAQSVQAATYTCRNGFGAVFTMNKDYLIPQFNVIDSGDLFVCQLGGRAGKPRQVKSRAQRDLESSNGQPEAQWPYMRMRCKDANPYFRMPHGCIR